MSVDEVRESWSRIEEWLRAHAPQTFASLNAPAEPAAIAAAEQAMGVSFSEDLVASLRIHDGTDSTAAGRFEFPGGFGLLSVDGMRQRWRMLADILAGLDADMAGSWWHPQWVPIAEHIAADALMVDLRPGAGQGAVGEFFHEDQAQLGRWPSVAALLAETADLLDGRRTDDRAVPRVASGRLIWTCTEQRHPRPRSLLAMAEKAGLADRPAESRPTEIDADEWILDLGRCCLTFAEGLSEAELLARFGGDPHRITGLTAGQVAAREASWRTGYRPMLRLGRTHGWAFGLEQRREYGVSTETLRRVSAGTRAVSVAANTSIIHFCYAEDGVVLVHYDNRWPERLAGADPQRFRPLLEQAGLLPRDPDRYFEDDTLGALALALRLGPGEFDPAVLAGSMPAAALLPLLADPPGEPVRLPVRPDPELVTVIEYATEDQLRPAVIALVRRRVHDLGLDDRPEIDAALAAAVTGVTGPVEDDSPLGRTLRTMRAEAHAATEARLDRVDRSARELLTDAERSTWQQRGRLADQIAAVLARPAVVGAYALAGSLDTFGDRAEFLTALADVAVPADAVQRLEHLEQERRRAGRIDPLWLRKSRRQPNRT